MKNDIDKISNSIKAAQQHLGLGAEVAAKRFKAAALAMNEMRLEIPKKIDLAKVIKKK
ncbi:hypothetical protein [Acinetobacter nosocomialis]|uniref:hypothetical protein n=1 Tax=Acinetobacter nosocomialis TaxID=106654 RepID=UPI0013566280|nr:hypothetical protein [Acinetobacter nosocomialis]